MNAAAYPVSPRARVTILGRNGAQGASPSPAIGWANRERMTLDERGPADLLLALAVTHHLAVGEPALAAAAGQVALRAGSSQDVPLLDLVAACDAQDNRAEADAYVRRILANHDAEVEEDLPPRTAEVLFRRQWLGRAS